jgi:hypothetical protein
MLMFEVMICCFWMFGGWSLFEWRRRDGNLGLGRNFSWSVEALIFGCDHLH